MTSKTPRSTQLFGLDPPDSSTDQGRAGRNASQSLAGGPTRNDPGPRILLTRLSHIGDCVLTLPLVQEIKRRWPAAHVSWAMESPAPKLLGHLPEIDQILSIPRSYLKSPRECWRLRGQLRAGKYDVAIDPQSLTKSSMLGWLSGAPCRIGFGGRHGRELSTWLNNQLVEPPAEITHLVDRTLLLVDKLEQWLTRRAAHPAEATRSIVGSAKVARLELALGDEEVSWVLAAQAAGQLPELFVVLNPGASWPSKRWENDRWAEVAAKLAAAGHSTLVTWAGAEEKAWAEEIVGLSRERIAAQPATPASGASTESGSSFRPAEVSVAPPTTLRQLAALCRNSQAFLGCDTGPMHIAAAVGAPCVVLFGPTRPQDSGPYGPGHQCLQAWHQSEASGQKKVADNRAMRAISIEDVTQACLSLVAGSRPNNGQQPQSDALWHCREAA